MSLINQMLSDLEQRKGGQPTLQKEILSDTLAPPRASSGNRSMRIGAAILLGTVLTAAGWWYLNNKTHPTQANHQASPTPTKAAPTSAVNTGSPLAPSLDSSIKEPRKKIEEKLEPIAATTSPPRLQSVHHGKLADIERIVLEFNQEPRYQFAHEIELGIATVEFEHATNPKGLSLAPQNSKLIKEITNTQGSKPLQIQLKLSQASNIKTITKGPGGSNNAQLIIELSPIAQAPENEITTPIAKSKTSTAAITLPKAKDKAPSSNEHKSPVQNENTQIAANSSTKKNTQASQQKPPIRRLTNKQQAHNLHQKALTLLSRQKLTEAKKTLTDALKLNPTNTQIRYTLAALLLKQGQLNDAEELLQAGLQTQPTNATFAMLYARLKAENNELAEAIQMMESALVNGKSNADYLAQLAALYQRQDQHSASITLYQQALKLRPTMGIWWMGLGISMEHGKKYQEASAAYQKAIQSGGLSTDVLAYVQERIKMLGRINR